MKMRNSFVSNSSSASFILELYTNDENMTKQDVIDIIEDRVGNLDGLSSTDRDLVEKGLKKIDNQKFVITTWTVMYNGPEDIPWYMKDFYVFHKLHPKQSGFWRVELKTYED